MSVAALTGTLILILIEGMKPLRAIAWFLAVATFNL